MSLAGYERQKLLGMLKICSRNTATALSTMVQGEVIPNMTSVLFKVMTDIFRIPKDNIVVVSDISGDLTGTMIASFTCEDGMKTINKMLGRDISIVKDLEMEEIGVLKEYINVMGGAFLSEFGNQIGFSCYPEIPNFEGRFEEVSGVMEAQLRALNFEILFINSTLQIMSPRAEAIFYVLFDQDSLVKIEKAIDKYQPPDEQ